MVHLFTATWLHPFGAGRMLFNGPFVLGPFSVDSEGRLSPVRQDSAPRFSVRWRGRIVHAELARTDTTEGRLSIHSNLGHFGGDASDAASRAASLAALSDLLTGWPEAWKLRLLPGQRPRLEVETMVTLPITVTNLVTELTAFLLELSPCLDLLDQAGARRAEP